MLNFKKSALLLVACTSTGFSEPVTFEVNALENSKEIKFSAKGLFVDDSGVCVLGLPNDITIQKIVSASGNTVEFVSYDPYARYGFVKLGEDDAKGKQVTTFSVDSSEETMKLMSGDSKFLVVGDVGTHNGKVIPFSFKRLHNQDYKKAKTSFPFLVNGQGKVLGMLHSDVLNTPGAFYSVPSAVIQKHLNDVLEFSQPTQAWVGVTLDANIDLPVVRSVRPASAAAIAGIQKGDIITKIGGEDVANYTSAVKAFYLLQAQKNAKFEVVRGDKRLQFSFAPKKYPSGSLR